LIVEPKDVQLKSVSGDITCTVEGHFSARLEAKNVSGDIDISLSQNVDVRFSAKTVSGNIKSKADLDDLEEKEGIASKSLSGQLGTGAGKIKTATVSGDIRLH